MPKGVICDPIVLDANLPLNEHLLSGALVTFVAAKQLPMVIDPTL